MSEHAACVRIGGILLRLSSNDPIEPGAFPSEYWDFCQLPSADAQPDVCVELDGAGPPPVVPGSGTDCGPWAYHRVGEARRLVWHGDREGALLWVAEYVPGTARVRVWCGPRLVRGQGGSRSIVNPFRYPLDQLVMMLLLAERGGLIVHSAGLVSDGRAIIAAGVSGAGKSTLSRLWAERHGSGSLLSDDRMIVRLAGAEGEADGPATAHGTPWPGELGAARSAGFPLAALVLLRQAPENALVPLSPREALERLLPNASVPWFDSELMPRSLEVAERVTARTPAYELRFTPEKQAIDLLQTLPEGR